LLGVGSSGGPFERQPVPSMFGRRGFGHAGRRRDFSVMSAAISSRPVRSPAATAASASVARRIPSGLASQGRLYDLGSPRHVQLARRLTHRRATGADNFDQLPASPISLSAKGEKKDLWPVASPIRAAKMLLTR
jgi:hypothetical protein